MKKILALLSITLLSAGIASASISESQTSEIEVLRSQGYSETALRVIDTVKSHNQGPTGKYRKHFTDKRQSAYIKVKNYFDPMQDDGKFGAHQINFTNTHSEQPEYAQPSVEATRYENL